LNQCQLHKTKKHTVCDCGIKSLSRLSLLPCGHTSLMWTNGKGVSESPPPCPSHSPPLSSPAVPRGLCGEGRGGGGEGGGKAWIVLTVSSQRPCSDWALWEIWAAGPPSRWLLFSGTFSCSRPSGAIGVPLSTIWDPVAGPGRTPTPGNNYSRWQPLDVQRTGARHVDGRARLWNRNGQFGRGNGSNDVTFQTRIHSDICDLVKYIFRHDFVFL